MTRSRFDCPSASLTLKALLKRTRRALWIGCVLALAIHVDVAEAMVRLARGAHDESPSAGFYSFGLGSGVVDVRLNRSLPDVNLPTVLEALEVARSEVTAGIVEMEDLGI